ncbi:hypothetical protein C8R47DRAFT_216506 [Mycena vitilis]|nr:hypothetical protein C8R47DRAFT_216506 [Mycena vitilis]
MGALPRPGNPLANLARLGSIISRDFEPHHGRLLLPVFFFVLENFKIPTLAEIDAYMNTTEPRLNVRTAWVFVAFQGLQRILAFGFIDPPALTDLWARMWPWIEFFHTYWDSLPCLPDLEPSAVMYGIFSSLILKLRSRTGDAAIERIVGSTHGVRTVLCRAWLHIVRARNNIHIHNICTFLRGHLQPQKKDNFDELLDGVGGNLSDLASIIVEHIEFLVPGPDSAVSTSAYPSFDGVFHIIGAAPLHDPGNTLINAQRSDGTVPAMITLIRAVSQSDVEQGNELIKLSFAVLVRLLVGSVAYRSVAEAFEGGLIPAILSSGMVNDPGVDRLLERLLRSILPGYTVYYSILSRMDEYMSVSPEFASRMKKAELSETFTSSWTIFASQVKSCRAVLESYDSGAYVSARACDNLACGIILAKGQFKRCSGCETLYYCSRQCQILDWRAGGHRQACEQYLNFAVGWPDILNTRDRSFMRALLDDQYQRNKADILSRKIATMLGASGRDMHVKFDYTVPDGGPELTFVMRMPKDRVESLADAHLAQNDYRQAQSGGRLEVVMMCVHDRPRFFALRSGTSALHDGVLQLVKEYSGKEPSEALLAGLRERVDNLVSLPVRQIHV